MSTIIMAACWPLQMSPTQKAVLVSLADQANDQGVCWPSLDTISTRTCLGRTAVIEAIKWLEAEGLITAHKVAGRSTHYTVNPSASRTGPGNGPVRQPDHPRPGGGLPPSGRRTTPVRQPDPNRKEPSGNRQRTEEQVAPPAPRAEPPPVPDEPIEPAAIDPSTGRPLLIPLNTGAEHPVAQTDVDEYRRLFPAVDVHRELLLARRWCLDNPTKRKTPRGVRSFLTRWLERAQDRAPSRPPPHIPGGHPHEAHRRLSASERVRANIAAAEERERVFEHA
jgi:hypothetical protein